MRKKVLIVITKSNWGGAQRYVYDMVTNMPHEYEVSVVAGGDGLLLKKLREKSVRTIPIESLTREVHMFTDLRAFYELYTLFKKEKPDIVHLNSSKAGALGALAARVAGVRRVIFAIHGWPHNEPVRTLSKMFRWSASLATILLAHESMTVSHFDRLHAPLGVDVKTVHNGVPDIEYVPRTEARKEIATKAGIPEDSFIIGSIAELHKNKGFDILTVAATLTQNAQFVIIGEGEERVRLEALIKEYKLEDRVHLIGFVDNAARLLKGFDIFVLPSRTEALGYVLLEAGMAELPVVATMVGGIPEIIDDQQTGVLVPAYDASGLAEALNELIASPNTRARYAEALHEKVARYFSLDDMVKKTISVYET